MPSDAETCHNCGTYTGTVLQAIIRKEPIGSASQVPIALSEDSSSSQVPVALSEDSSLAATSLDQAEESPIEVVVDTDDVPLQTETTNESSLEVTQAEDSQDTQSASELMEEDTTQPLSSPALSSLADDSGDNLLSAAASTSSPVYLAPEGRYRLLVPHCFVDCAAAKTVV